MLPCKRQPLRMWEFNPEGPRTIKHFLGLKLEGMCKLFFGPQVKCPDTTEDAGLSCNHLDAQVSSLKAGYFIYIYHNIILKILRCQEWLSKAERIRCPAPLPEGSPGPTIAKMLGRVLSKMPSGKDKGKDSEAELHTLRIRTEGIASYPREDSRGGEAKASSPRGKKGAASKDLEAEMPKLGKKTSLGGPAPTGTLTASCPPTGQPSTEP